MSADSYILHLVEQTVPFSLRISKIAAEASWSWSATVGDAVTGSSGSSYKSADAAQAFGEAWCREIAREQLQPHRQRSRLELAVAQAQLAHDLALMAAAGLDVPESARPANFVPDARSVCRVNETRHRVAELRRQLDDLNRPAD